ncbi:hypothetical protein N7509_001342 [Penicillium cosmopolitanum]|uniref:Uncharacterized protein n=1 Tax=Penicillium cosmopolitanum TaxID=1131564 RepID=A0A9W9WBW5_9EURO|nr:uncharacterized protein N7509_001342 [Penicillium cosmopolitanum]KAJ5414715.1 hypothetical protein N7509_001342 [Penicillium cosmopolitanum]
MTEGYSFSEEQGHGECRIASGSLLEGTLCQNAATSELFDLAKKVSSTPSFEPPLASFSSDAYSNAGAGTINPEIDLPGSSQRMQGSPFVTPIGNAHPNIQQQVPTLFGEADKTSEARIRVLEEHVLALQAENVDLYRRMSLMESMSSRAGASPVHGDRNSASGETVRNHVANHSNPPIENAISGVYRRMDRRHSDVNPQVGHRDPPFKSKSEKQGTKLESSPKGHVLICEKEHKYPFIVNGATKREVDMADRLAGKLREVVKLEKDAASSHLQDQKDAGMKDIFPREASFEQNTPDCGGKMVPVVKVPVSEGSREIPVVGKKLEPCYENYELTDLLNGTGAATQIEDSERIGREIRKEVGTQLGGIFNLEVRNIVEVELAGRFKNLAADISNTSISFMATGGNFPASSNESEKAGNDLVSLALQSMVTNTMSKLFDSQEERLEVIKNRLNYHEDLLEYANDCTDYSEQADDPDTSRDQFTRSRIESPKSDEISLGSSVQPGEDIPFQTPICQNIIQSYGPFGEPKADFIQHAIEHDFDSVKCVDQKETCEPDSSAHTFDYDFDRITSGETHERAEIWGLHCTVDYSPLLSITLPTSQPACMDALEAVIYSSGSCPVPLGPSATSPGISKTLPAPPINSQISGLETDVGSIESQLDGGLTTGRQGDTLNSYVLESLTSGNKAGGFHGPQAQPLLTVPISRHSPRNLTGTVIVTNTAIDASSGELEERSSSLVKNQILDAMQEKLHSMAAMSSQISELESRRESLEKYGHPAGSDFQPGHASTYQIDPTTYLEADDQELPSPLVKEGIHEAIQKELHEVRGQIHLLNSRIDLLESGPQSDPASTRAHFEAPTASEEAAKELPAPVTGDPTSRPKSPDPVTNDNSWADEIKAFLQAEVEKAVGLEFRQMHAMIMTQINSRIELLKSDRQSGPVPTRARPKLPASYSRIPPTPMNFRMVAPPSLSENPELLERHFQLELHELISTQVACFETRMSSRMDRLEYRMSSISLSLSNLWQNVWNLGASMGGWNTWALGMGMWNPV